LFSIISRENERHTIDEERDIPQLFATSLKFGSCEGGSFLGLHVESQYENSRLILSGGQQIGDKDRRQKIEKANGKRNAHLQRTSSGSTFKSSNKRTMPSALILSSPSSLSGSKIDKAREQELDLCETGLSSGIAPSKLRSSQ
jgi:hypothetical protein